MYKTSYKFTLNDNELLGSWAHFFKLWHGLCGADAFVEEGDESLLEGGERCAEVDTILVHDEVKKKQCVSLWSER